MKELEHYESLIRREVPAALDRRILAAAKQEAKKLRFRRLFRRCSLTGAAAAAALLVGSGIFWFQPETNDARAAETQELLALNDWSKVEQENYNLNFELYCGRQAFSELAGLNMLKGN